MRYIHCLLVCLVLALMLAATAQARPMPGPKTYHLSGHLYVN